MLEKTPMKKASADVRVVMEMLNPTSSIVSSILLTGSLRGSVLLYDPYSMNASSRPIPNIRKGIMVVTGVNATPNINKRPYPVIILSRIQTTAPIPSSMREWTRCGFQKTKQQKPAIITNTAGKRGRSLIMDRKNSSLYDRYDEISM